jgi:branched-subunit amino acid transport protein
MDGRVVEIIIGMALVTYLPRMFPLVTLSRLELPEILKKWLKYVPVSVFSALLFPSLLLKNGRIDLGFGNFQVWAGLICLAVMLRTRSLALTVSIGVLAVLLFKFL